MSDLLKLAERCEAATGPDRELDAQIGRFVAAEFLQQIPDRPQYGCQPFTASLDAAMQLKPAEWHIEGMHEGCGDLPKRVTLYCWDEAIRGKGSALTLALCAAALRARAAQPPSPKDK